MLGKHNFALVILFFLSCQSFADDRKSIFDEDWKPTTQSSQPQESLPPKPTNVTPLPVRTPHRPRPTTKPAAVTVPTVEEPAPRVNLPDPAMQAQTLKLIKQVFDSEYRQAAPSARAQLASHLLTEAQKVQNNLDAKYVLLTQALEIATGCGEASICRQALQELDNGFVIDLPSKVHDAILILLAKPPLSPDTLNWAADIAQSSIRDAQYDFARKMVVACLPKAPAESDLLLRFKGLQAALAEHERVRPSEERLKSSPNDPAANLAVGKFDILIREDWPNGLICLARGNDPKLKELATADIFAPADAASQFALAGRWWDLGTGDASWKLRASQRAAHWYEKCATNLNELEKALANKRVVEAQKLALNPPVFGNKEKQPPDLISLLSVSGDVPKAWKWDDGDLVAPNDRSTARFPVQPNGEYDLRIVFVPAQNFGTIRLLLTANHRDFSVIVGSDYTSLDQINGVPGNANKSRIRTAIRLEPDRPVTLVVKVRRHGVGVYSEGTTLIEYTTDYSDLNQASNWSIGVENIGVGSYDGKFRVKQAQVFEASSPR